MVLILPDRRALTIDTPWLTRAIRRELRDQPRPPEAGRARCSTLASPSTAARPRAPRPRRTGGARARAGPEDGEAPAVGPCEAERPPEPSPAVPLTSQQSAGLASLLDLLTASWAEEVAAAARAPSEPSMLTSDSTTAQDAEEQAGPPRRGNATAAPDPQRDHARAGSRDRTRSHARALLKGRQ
jgi:hypothetical protein